LDAAYLQKLGFDYMRVVGTILQSGVFEAAASAGPFQAHDTAARRRFGDSLSTKLQ